MIYHLKLLTTHVKFTTNKNSWFLIYYHMTKDKKKEKKMTDWQLLMILSESSSRVQAKEIDDQWSKDTHFELIIGY